MVKRPGIRARLAAAEADIRELKADAKTARVGIELLAEAVLDLNADVDRLSGPGSVLRPLPVSWPVGGKPDGRSGAG